MCTAHILDRLRLLEEQLVLKQLIKPLLLLLPQGLQRCLLLLQVLQPLLDLRGPRKEWEKREGRGIEEWEGGREGGREGERREGERREGERREGERREGERREGERREGERREGERREEGGGEGINM